jgi:hypothetical protein
MSDNIHGDLIRTKDGYMTCDLYLAAFFVASGCPIKNTKSEPRKVHFLFDDNEILERLKLAYYTRQGKIDGLSYADNIKSLKSLCASILSAAPKRI